MTADAETGEAEEPERPHRAWNTVGVLAFYAAGHFVGMPGVDRVVDERARNILSFIGAPALLHVFSLGLSALVLVRGALTILPRTRDDWPGRERWAFAIYAIISLGLGLWAAILAENARWLGREFVRESGALFRVSTALTLCAGSAIVWQLSRILSERGLGHGPLVLLGATAWVQKSDAISSLGQLWALGEVDSVWLVSPLAEAFAVGAVLCVLARRDAVMGREIFFRGVVASSRIDIALSPLLAGFVVGSLLIAPLHLDLPREVTGFLERAGTIATLSAAAVLVFRFGQRASCRYLDHYLVAGLTLPFLAILYCISSAETSSPGFFRRQVERLLEPREALTLEPERPGLTEAEATADAEIIARRLADLGGRPSVDGASPEKIVLRVTRSLAASSSLARALEPSCLEIAAEALDQSLLAPDGSQLPPGLTTERDVYRGLEGLRSYEIYEGPTRASLAPVALRDQATESLQNACHARAERLERLSSPSFPVGRSAS